VNTALKCENVVVCRLYREVRAVEIVEAFCLIRQTAPSGKNLLICSTPNGRVSLGPNRRLQPSARVK